MKLVKLTLTLAAFLAVSQSAFAVGPMEKSDIRDGQLICEGLGAGLKEGRNVASANEDTRPVRTDATTAQ